MRPRWFITVAIEGEHAGEAAIRLLAAVADEEVAISDAGLHAEIVAKAHELHTRLDRGGLE